MLTRAMLERFAIMLLFLCFLLFGLIVTGKIGKSRSETVNSTTNIISAPVGRDIMINLGKPKAYVTIKADGTVIYGDDYDPDATAKAFWENLGERRNCK